MNDPDFLFTVFLFTVYRLYKGHVNHCVTFDVEYLGNC